MENRLSMGGAFNHAERILQFLKAGKCCFSFPNILSQAFLFNNNRAPDRPLLVNSNGSVNATGYSSRLE